MANLVLTLVGEDRPGLVSAVAKAVSDNDGSWDTGQLAQLAGKFAGIVLVAVPDEKRSDLVTALEALAAEGLSVSVTEGSPTGGSLASGTPLRLYLVGDDRPGIVQQISAVLAGQQISIERLETLTRPAPMTNEPLFEATAELVAPEGLDRDQLTAALESLANELMVDLDLGE